MKLCTVAYVPPPGIGYQPEAFLQNLGTYRTKHDLVLLSDHPWPLVASMPAPEAARLARDATSQRMDFSVNNFIFLLSISHVLKKGYTHAIYLESDSRVGVAGWDEVVYDEFFRSGKPSVCGGSIVCYNPYNGGQAAAEGFNQLVIKHNCRRNFPVTAYMPQVKAFGSKSSADATGSAVFPNGSISVWDLEFLKVLIGKGPLNYKAAEWSAWDLELGKTMWAHFGAGVYDLVSHLSCIYSSYGNALTTESERLEMLRSGRVIATHQVKSDAVI